MKEFDGFSLFEQQHPPKSVDNISCCTITPESIAAAEIKMEEFINNPAPVKTNVRIVPPTITLTETKYWIPYGNVAVPVKEEVTYKFVYRIQSYLRDKKQDVSLPRKWRW